MSRSAAAEDNVTEAVHGRLEFASMINRLPNMLAGQRFAGLIFAIAAREIPVRAFAPRRRGGNAPIMPLHPGHGCRSNLSGAHSGDEAGARWENSWRILRPSEAGYRRGLSERRPDSLP
jgi:hypothetical protein